MRWQDEKPINDLINEGVQTAGSYLTIARVGEDRKESQIGSQPIADARRAREWLDRNAEAAAVATGCARFRTRLWRANRTTVRSVQTRGWVEPDALSIGAPPVFVPNAPRPESKRSVAWDPLKPDESDSGPDPYYHLDAPSPSGSWPASPALATRLPTDAARLVPAPQPLPADPPPVSRLAALAAKRSEPSASAPSRPVEGSAEAGGGARPAGQRPTTAPSHQPSLVQRYAPQPAYSPQPVYAPAPYVPCPTCASAATTIATQNARLAELSGRVAALNVALRDKQDAAARAQTLADQRLARISTLEAEGNRAAQMIVSQRKELAEAHESAQEMIATINSFDE